MNSSITARGHPGGINRWLATRWGGLVLFAVLFLVIALGTRLALALHAMDFLEWSFWPWLRILSIGLFYDVITLFYFISLFVVYLTVTPDRFFAGTLNKTLYNIVFFSSIYVLLFNGVAEWIFWDEFGVRFNFIAVDYLVYTQEVIGNIRQSYPVPTLLFAILVMTVMIFWWIWRLSWMQSSWQAVTTFRQRAIQGSVLLALPVLAFVTVDARFAEHSGNRFHNELAKNGIYALFTAFWHNKLEYERFYPQHPEAKAAARVRELLSMNPGSESIPDGDPLDIARRIQHPGPEKRLNVIQLTIESLSAEFMALFGNTAGLTPHLDQLAQESLTFTNLYATGNRTDRGMESLVLSIPPTPGRSKVKRPNNENLFSSGFLFRERGYDTKFIYGGYGYFDNMNYFFSHNGFDVVDRTRLASHEITHENIWGVADEDLFRRVLVEADGAHAVGKPFYHFVMTTSNHRPFTYPAGRIDIPSPGGRAGGVKYTDWAIGAFLQQARSRPWFDDTLFVIVADHCASSAGKSDLPVFRYHIPLMIYAPRHVVPRMETGLMSQIDVTPTVLGLLGWSYTSRFFGQDLLRSDLALRRAFIGTYQKLGLIVGDRLSVLTPQQSARFYRFTRGPGRESQELLAVADESMLFDTIAFYQTAHIMHQKRLDQWLR
ncbi:MAG: sulfatase-like hydrolase/transferase [Magnetococcales bacterium]|nr:sulfatase-like hydrolase/transferase [Magnetococcales bacterium]